MASPPSMLYPSMNTSQSIHHSSLHQNVVRVKKERQKRPRTSRTAGLIVVVATLITSALDASALVSAPLTETQDDLADTGDFVARRKEQERRVDKSKIKKRILIGDMHNSTARIDINRHAFLAIDVSVTAFPCDGCNFYAASSSVVTNASVNDLSPRIGGSWLVTMNEIAPVDNSSAIHMEQLLELTWLQDGMRFQATENLGVLIPLLIPPVETGSNSDRTLVVALINELVDKSRTVLARRLATIPRFHMHGLDYRRAPGSSLIVSMTLEGNTTFEVSTKEHSKSQLLTDSLASDGLWLIVGAMGLCALLVATIFFMEPSETDQSNTRIIESPNYDADLAFIERSAFQGDSGSHSRSHEDSSRKSIVEETIAEKDYPSDHEDNKGISISHETVLDEREAVDKEKNNVADTQADRNQGLYLPPKLKRTLVDISELDGDRIVFPQSCGAPPAVYDRGQSMRSVSATGTVKGCPTVTPASHENKANVQFVVDDASTSSSDASNSGDDHIEEMQDINLNAGHQPDHGRNIGRKLFEERSASLLASGSVRDNSPPTVLGETNDTMLCSSTDQDAAENMTSRISRSNGNSDYSETYPVNENADEGAECINNSGELESGGERSHSSGILLLETNVRPMQDVGVGMSTSPPNDSNTQHWDMIDSGARARNVGDTRPELPLEPSKIDATNTVETKDGIPSRSSPSGGSLRHSKRNSEKILIEPGVIVGLSTDEESRKKSVSEEAGVRCSHENDTNGKASNDECNRNSGKLGSRDEGASSSDELLLEANVRPVQEAGFMSTSPPNDSITQHEDMIDTGGSSDSARNVGDTRAEVCLEPSLGRSVGEVDASKTVETEKGIPSRSSLSEVSRRRSNEGVGGNVSGPGQSVGLATAEGPCKKSVFTSHEIDAGVQCSHKKDTNGKASSGQCNSNGADFREEKMVDSNYHFDEPDLDACTGWRQSDERSVATSIVAVAEDILPTPRRDKIDKALLLSPAAVRDAAKNPFTKTNLFAAEIDKEEDCSSTRKEDTDENKVKSPPAQVQDDALPAAVTDRLSHSEAYTSLVAIDDVDRRVSGRPEAREVPCTISVLQEPNEQNVDSKTAAGYSTGTRKPTESDIFSPPAQVRQEIPTSTVGPSEASPHHSDSDSALQEVVTCIRTAELQTEQIPGTISVSRYPEERNLTSVQDGSAARKEEAENDTVTPPVEVRDETKTLASKSRPTVGQTAANPNGPVVGDVENDQSVKSPEKDTLGKTSVSLELKADFTLKNTPVDIDRPFLDDRADDNADEPFDVSDLAEQSEVVDLELERGAEDSAESNWLLRLASMSSEQAGATPSEDISPSNQPEQISASTQEASRHQEVVSSTALDDDSQQGASFSYVSTLPPDSDASTIGLSLGSCETVELQESLVGLPTTQSNQRKPATRKRKRNGINESDESKKLRCEDAPEDDFYVWTNLWSHLTEAGWKAVRPSNPLHDWYFVRPGHDAKVGIDGIDYFKSPDEVIDYAQRMELKKHFSLADASNEKPERFREEVCDLPRQVSIVRNSAKKTTASCAQEVTVVEKGSLSENRPARNKSKRTKVKRSTSTPPLRDSNKKRLKEKGDTPKAFVPDAVTSLDSLSRQVQEPVWQFSAC